MADEVLMQGSRIIIPAFLCTGMFSGVSTRDTRASTSAVTWHGSQSGGLDWQQCWNTGEEL